MWHGLTRRDVACTNKVCMCKTISVVKVSQENIISQYNTHYDIKCYVLHACFYYYHHYYYYMYAIMYIYTYIHYMMSTWQSHGHCAGVTTLRILTIPTSSPLISLLPTPPPLFPPSPSPPSLIL